MHNKPLSKRSLAQIKTAVENARVYAQENKIPLTAERLAAALDMDLSIFRAAVEGKYTEKGVKKEQLAGKLSVLQSAFAEATASVMEHAMQRGSSPNMHMLYLKENAGYGEKSADVMPVTAPVIFIGEEEILP